MADAQARYDAVIDAPFGHIAVVLHDGALVDVSFVPASSKLMSPRTPDARRVCAQLRTYLRNPHAGFDVRLALGGTPFQQRVWRALCRIPPGQVVTYGALARRLKSSARAVGNACRANPVPIIVPCHRVVSANGEGGFMGQRGGPALDLKRWLLEHERGR